MLVNCGFLDKSAGYYYYVQNIKLASSGWKSVSVIYNGEIIKQYNNNNKELFFELVSDNNYNINLTVNGDIIKQTRSLFKIDLDIDSNDDNCYSISEGLIVDH